MSESVGLTLDASKLAEIIDRLSATDAQAAFALTAAANHAARLAQKLGMAKINDATKVELATLRRRLKMTTAQGVRSNGKIRYSSAKGATLLRRRARVWFGAWGVDPVRDLTVPVVQDDRGVTAGRYRWDHAFQATMDTGSRGVFARKGKPRLPIARQFASVHGQAFAILTGDIFPVVAEAFYKHFEAQLLREITLA